MKKKGFTLIELLAVIVILAIIALISTPIVIGVIEKARKGAFEDSAYGVLEAGKIYYVDKLADHNSFTGESFDFSKANNLKLSGEKPAGGMFVLDNTGRQALAIYDKDKKWCAYKDYNEEKITIQEYKEEDCKVVAPLVTVVQMLQNKNTAGNTEGLFTDDYGNIRYRGASAKNYVTFNNEVWRMIGIVDAKVKLIKDEKVIDLAWNTNFSNEWLNSSTQAYLNKDYYNSLTDTAKAMSENHIYKLGGITTTGIYSKDIYLLEREKTVYTGRSTEWTGKIGLAYPSDYGYAAGSGCTKDLLNYGKDTMCIDDNWMYKSKYRWWLMTPNSNSSLYVTTVYNNGTVYEGYHVTSSYGLRPVLHLQDSIQIAGGDGTSSNPYTLV